VFAIGLASAVALALPMHASAATLTGPATVDEDAGTVTYQGTCAATDSISVSASDGTAPPATQDADYSAPVVTDPCGLLDPNFTVAVDITDDDADEEGESFVVNVDAGVLGTNDSVETTITDDDPLIRIAKLVPILEGDSGTTTASVPVILAAPAAKDTTIDWNAEPASAERPSDFTGTGGQLVIPSGASAGAITIPIVGDTVVEPPEAFFVNLTATDNGRIDAQKSQAAVGIVDLDKPPPPVLSIPQSVKVKEGDRGRGNVLFDVTLSTPATEAVTVDWKTAHFTAKGQDYLAGSGKLTFKAGQKTKTISVNVLGDELDEPDEAFALGLENPVGLTLARKGAVAIIEDDDGPQVGIGEPRLKPKKLVTTITCPDSASGCKGRLVGRSGKKLRLGRTKFDLATGESTDVVLKLSKKARKKLARKSRKAKLTATVTDIDGFEGTSVLETKLPKLTDNRT